MKLTPRGKATLLRHIIDMKDVIKNEIVIGNNSDVEVFVDDAAPLTDGLEKLREIVAKTGYIWYEDR